MENGKLPVYILTNETFEGVLNYPVIKINFLSPSFSFENIDYLLFTSKNGVRAVDKLTDEWKKFPSFAIGAATAREIENLGGKVEYIAKKAYGDEFAEEINEKYKHKTFLFFRAKKLVSEIEDKFVNNTLKQAVVYETLCANPGKKLIKPSVVIFTSPSTVKCFSKIENFENIRSVAIGKKTEKELLKHINRVYVANKPLINECIKLAKLLKIR
jgi:uroporphyrinogen-III synthase